MARSKSNDDRIVVAKLTGYSAEEVGIHLLEPKISKLNIALFPYSKGQLVVELTGYR